MANERNRRRPAIGSRGLPLTMPDRRRTKIVATIGPASRSPERLAALLGAGVDVVRLNFSHGTQADAAQAIANVRAASAAIGRPIAILQDLQGPKIRTGRLTDDQPIELQVGHAFTITIDDITGTPHRVATTYAGLPRDVNQGDRILLADGAFELRVTGKNETEVFTEVIRGGQLRPSQGINLPGVSVSAPALTEKDEQDLAFGIAAGVDFVALSFVRSPADVHRAKTFIADHGGDIPVIAKLERPEAIEQLDAILVASDGVMVARGDLGVEMPPEYVPVLQKRIISRANEHALPVITATQMLESMIQNARPTRAEASDVANAIFDGTDAVMLSGETAIGAYPVETVQIMDRIVRAAEAVAPIPTTPSRDLGPAHAITRAATRLAEDLSARAIVVFTQSGRTTELLASDHPETPIFSLTPSDTIYRRLALRWGVHAIQTHLEEDTDAMIALMEDTLVERNLLRPGDRVVIVGATPIVARARTNFLKVHTIRAE
jgi:pyruvate kinase